MVTPGEEGRSPRLRISSARFAAIGREMQSAALANERGPGRVGSDAVVTVTDIHPCLRGALAVLMVAWDAGTAREGLPAVIAALRAVLTRCLAKGTTHRKWD